MKIQYFQDIINRFAGKKILVVGDAMLDMYIRGEVERISSEAPVPIVLEKEREYVLGGAGNVAANIASLGGSVALAGVAGNDAEGRILRRLCRSARISPKLFSETRRPTSLKIRVAPLHHQLLRVDREIKTKISGLTEKKIITAIDRSGNYDFIVMSDYSKGCLTPKIVEFLKHKFGPKKILSGIRPLRAELHRGVAAVVLNTKEAEEIMGIGDGRGFSIAGVVKALAKFFNSSIVLTRGEYGMTIYDRKVGKIFNEGTRALRVYDVTGAGDTVVAVIALALAAGAQLKDAADIANHAAGIVVGIKGTATVTPAELKSAFRA